MYIYMCVCLFACIYRRGGEKTSPPGKKNTHLLYDTKHERCTTDKYYYTLECIIRLVLTKMRLFGAVSGFWQVQVIYSNTNHQHGRIVPVKTPSETVHISIPCLVQGGPTGLQIYWELRLMFMLTFQTLLAALNRTQQNTYNSGTQEFMTHEKKINCSSSWLTLLK